LGSEKLGNVKTDLPVYAKFGEDWTCQGCHAGERDKSWWNDLF